jgi:hypothetical protein
MPFYERKNRSAKNATTFSFTFYFKKGVSCMLENRFKTNLAREIKNMFPGCMVLHLDPNEIQGIPDLLVLYKNKWAVLEGKKNAHAIHQPNQDYYVDLMNDWSFAAFIYPENKDEVLDDLYRYFTY